MLVIRLNRTGRKNRSHFRIAVQEKTVAPGGRHVEMVGSWDPHKKVAVLENDRILHWLGQGAQPSDTVYNLLVAQGVVEGKKRAVKMERPKVEENVQEVAEAVKEGLPESAQVESDKVEEDTKAEPAK